MEEEKKPDKETLKLFDVDEYDLQRKEWVGMPEFVQKDITSYRDIIIHFENEKDVQDFAKLLNQTITSKTKYLWYPKIKIESYMDKRYVDES